MVMKDNGILECPECKTEFVVEGGNNVSKEKAEKLNDLKNEYKELQDAMNKYEKMEEEVRKSLDPFEDSEKLTLLHLIHKEMDSIGKHMEEIENGINQGYTR
jgi:uncharacterized Zn finger protein (UPF0148 family)